MSAHASQAFSIVHFTDSEDLPRLVSQTKQLCSSHHAFLANTGNKAQFIVLLGSRIVQSGHTVGSVETLHRTNRP